MEGVCCGIRVPAMSFPVTLIIVLQLDDMVIHSYKTYGDRCHRLMLTHVYFIDHEHRFIKRKPDGAVGTRWGGVRGEEKN